MTVRPVHASPGGPRAPATYREAVTGPRVRSLVVNRAGFSWKSEFSRQRLPPGVDSTVVLTLELGGRDVADGPHVA